MLRPEYGHKGSELSGLGLPRHQDSRSYHDGRAYVSPLVWSMPIETVAAGIG